MICEISPCICMPGLCDLWSLETIMINIKTAGFVTEAYRAYPAILWSGCCESWHRQCKGVWDVWSVSSGMMEPYSWPCCILLRTVYAAWPKAQWTFLLWFAKSPFTNGRKRNPQIYSLIHLYDDVWIILKETNFIGLIECMFTWQL